MRLRTILFLFGLILSQFTLAEFSGPSVDPDAAKQETMFVTPSADFKPVIDAIKKAQSEIIMTMYHLTDRDVIQALGEATKRNVNVRVIVDGKSTNSNGGKRAFDEIKSLGVDIRGSSNAFSLTHSKTMLIDKSLAFVSSVNMTSLHNYARDFGIFTRDSKIAADLLAVFEADWKNAQDGTMVTPSLTSDRLVWSPVNSADVLMEFINESKSSIDLYVENLGSQEILKSLEAAAKRGVNVRVNVPLCDMNPADPFYNTKPKDELLNAGVHFKVMPGAGTADIPYIHAKMIMVDGKKAYVGSVNFSINSLHFARETGIFVDQSDIIKKISDTYDADWALTTDVPDKLDRSLCKQTLPTDNVKDPQFVNSASAESPPMPSVEFIYSRGNSSGFCDGTAANFWCFDQLKKRANDDAIRDADLQCSMKKGMLNSISAVCSNMCTPFSIPANSPPQLVTCSSSCNTRCEFH